MNTELWLNIAKYKAKVRNTDWDQYRAGYTEYPITESEYAKLKLAIHNKEPFTWIHDLMWSRVREINAKRDIKEFLPIVHTKQEYWKRWVCSFWIRHPITMYDWCDCYKKFWCPGLIFKDKLKEIWFDIYYDSDITEEMRQKYLLTI